MIGSGSDFDPRRQPVRANKNPTAGRAVGLKSIQMDQTPTAAPVSSSALLSASRSLMTFIGKEK
ncbi:MAG TPA: hypothetical protein DCY13_18745 [Verrucomicrobiales bacterium]|nr:hypothetical protein [Verrucomicrobiales bacterium]